MSVHKTEVAFLSTVIPYDDSDEPLKLQKRIEQLHCDERCVRRLAWAMILFLVLSMAGVGYGSILQENFPYNLPQLVIDVLCGFVLASLVCLVTFAALLAIYRRKLHQLREESRRLVARLLESQLSKPHLPTSGTSHANAGLRKIFQGAGAVDSGGGSQA